MSRKEAQIGRTLGPLKIRDVPKYLGWLALFGPGMIWAGVAQGSGESIWWPYMVAKYGLYFLPFLIPFAAAQWWVNQEIVRYTVNTGESVIQGFHRIHRYLGWLVYALVFIAIFWLGGYASGAGTALAKLTSFPFGWSLEWRSKFWAEIIIIIAAICFLLGPVAFHVVEVVETIAAIISFVGMLAVVVIYPPVHAVAGEFFAGLFTWRGFPPPNWDPADISVLMTLVAYTGMGGYFNLMYSYWVRDKGYCMARYVGRVTSPVTGKPETVPTEGFVFEPTPENLEEYKKWYRWTWIDNTLGVVLNLITIMLTSILSYTILFPKRMYPKGWKLLSVQAAWFGEVWGPIGAAVLLFVLAFFLGDTFFSCIDFASRATADMIHINSKAARKRPYRWWYWVAFAFWWVIGVITVLVAKPRFLILSGGVANLFCMAIYNPLLIYLNWHLVPKGHPAGKAVRPTVITLILMIIVSAYFIGAAVFGTLAQLGLI